MNNDGVDIMLTLSKEEHRIRGRRARLGSNQNSNALLLVVNHKKAIHLNGELIENESRVILGPRTRLHEHHCAVSSIPV